MKIKITFGLISLATVMNLSAQNNTSWNVNSVPIPGTGANNSGFGSNVLISNTSGNDNAAIGYRALRNNTTGSYNCAIGTYALGSNLSGTGNVAEGSGALFNNTSGGVNVSIGAGSLGGNTTGSSNCAIGAQALAGNVSGNNITAIGYMANTSANNLSNATAIGANALVTANNSIQLGDGNVTQVFAGTGTNATIITGGLQVTGGSPAVGRVLTSDASGNATWQAPSGGSGWSLTGNAGTFDGTNFIGTTDNVPFNIRVDNQKAGRIESGTSTANSFFGYRAGNVNVGNMNVGIGCNALLNNTNGSRNSSTGYNTLYYNTTGFNNSAFGMRALYNNSGGFDNTAIGMEALRGNINGEGNVALGSYALNNNINGNYNTACGIQSLDGNTGNNNTASGAFALSFNFTGNNNTGLGCNANVSSNINNATAIGNGAISNANDKVVIGNTAVGMVIGGFANWSNLSDGRFKENVKEDVPGVEFIKKLRPVTYVIDLKKLDTHLTQNMPDSVKAKHMQSPEAYALAASKIQTGFIAQEVEKAAKELGYNFDGVNAPKNPTDNYSIAYSQFIMPLVKAVQEQQAMILSQQNELKTQKQLITELNNKVATSTGINSFSNIEAGFQMSQNEPNPFTHETVVKYTLPQTVTNAFMAVYDLTGKQITTFPIDQKGASFITITSEKLSPGIYIYSIVADGKVMDSKRMIVADKY